MLKVGGPSIGAPPAPSRARAEGRDSPERVAGCHAGLVRSRRTGDVTGQPSWSRSCKDGHGCASGRVRYHRDAQPPSQKGKPLSSEDQAFRHRCRLLRLKWFAWAGRGATTPRPPDWGFDEVTRLQI